MPQHKITAYMTRTVMVRNHGRDEHGSENAQKLGLECNSRRSYCSCEGKSFALSAKNAKDLALKPLALCGWQMRQRGAQADGLQVEGKPAIGQAGKPGRGVPSSWR